MFAAGYGSILWQYIENAAKFGKILRRVLLEATVHIYL